MQDALFFLNCEDYGTYYRPLAKSIGLQASVLLCELVTNRRHFMKSGKIYSDEKHGSGWFYQTIDNVFERTGLSRKEQETALKKLHSLQLIEQKVMGKNTRRHFRLNDRNILKVINLGSKDRIAQKGQSRGSDCPKGTIANVRKGQSLLIRNKNISKEHNSSRNIRCVSQPALRLVDLFYQKILESDPKAKPPNRDAWSREFEKMNRIDKRTWEEIEEMILFCQNDQFWKSNVLSPSKLRKQATQLSIRMKSLSKSQTSNCEENKELAKSLENFSIVKNTSVKISALNSYVEVGNGVHQPTCIKYSENGFKDQLDNALRKWNFPFTLKKANTQQ